LLAADWSALLIAVVWQSTLLAAVVAVVAWLLRRSTPSIRYWLWQIVAIKILFAPLWTLAVPLAWVPEVSPFSAMSSREHVASTPPAAAQSKSALAESALLTARSSPVAPSPPAAETGTPSLPIAPGGPMAVPSTSALSWRAWLMFAWAVIVVAQLVVLLGQRARLVRLLRQASPASAALDTLVAQCATRLRLGRVPRVLVTEVECSPFVCGLSRTVMVLPRSLESLLPQNEIEPVLIHELAHVKRYDLFFGWIPQLARMFYFFHPIAHLVAFRTRLEAELACDGWAMAESGHGAGAYADLLVRVVSRLSEPAMLRSGSTASAGLDGQESLSDT
jgi:beta-lactamase regulating signal transducer with metallopeptidase domain